MPAPVVAVHTVTLPNSSRCLSVLQLGQPAAASSASLPLVLFLSAMELHSHVLCPQLHCLPRNVQLSRKASYRQDLAKLRVPYRIASKPELTALKQRGLLSMQAPSSMLIAWKDAMRLLKEKGEKAVRKRLRRWRQRKAEAQPARRTARGVRKQQGSTLDASSLTATERTAGDAVSGSDSMKAAVVAGQSAALTAAAEDEDGEEEDEEEEEEDGSSDEEEGGRGGFPASAVTVVSSLQFRIMWQQPSLPPLLSTQRVTLPSLTVTLPVSPSSPPSLSSTPSSRPSTPASLPSLPLPSPSSFPSPLAIGGLYRRPVFARVLRPKTPRKCSSPFSLSYITDDEDADHKQQQQQQQRHSAFSSSKRQRVVY